MTAQIDEFPHIFPSTYNFLQVDYHGRYTAGSGRGIYTARAFPEKFWNRGAFMGEPTAHLMGQFFIEPLEESVGCVAKNRGAADSSTAEWGCHVHMEVGRVGQLLISRW